METNQLTEIFKALADPTRMRIITLLSDKNLRCDCSSNLLNHLKITQPTLSHHIKQLLQAGIISETRNGNFRHYQVTENWKRVISNFLQTN